MICIFLDVWVATELLYGSLYDGVVFQRRGLLKDNVEGEWSI